MFAYQHTTLSHTHTHTHTHRSVSISTHNTNTHTEVLAYQHTHTHTHTHTHRGASISTHTQKCYHITLTLSHTHTDHSSLTSVSWILLSFLASVFDNVPLTAGSSKQTSRRVQSTLISALLLSEERHTRIIIIKPLDINTALNSMGFSESPASVIMRVSNAALNASVLQF